MIFHCALAIFSLCGALRDAPVRDLTILHAAVASVDWGMTRTGMSGGGIEADPLARPFVHSNLPMIVGAMAEVGLTAMVAERAHRSHNRLIRRTWWLWQVAPAVAHAYGAGTWVHVWTH